ncbi:MAG: acyl-CoA thioesterase/BAAT N-terminal domain-containing protein [Pseudomonadota bacterium]
MRFSLLVGLAAIAACQSHLEPELSVTDAPILDGDPIEIELRNVEPDSLVTLRLDEIRMRRGKPSFYTSMATFLTATDGTLSTTRDAPISGSYEGADQAGIFWSRERPADQQPDESAELMPLNLSVDLGGDGSVEFERQIEIVSADKEIKTLDLGDEFPGAIYAIPTGDGPHPVIIVLGGSEGNDRTARNMVPHFASRGYLAVGVPYYSPAWGDQPQQIPGLPRAFAELPVDYLEGITAHIKTLEVADPHRIGIWGVSKGAEYALLAGQLIGDYAAIAAIVPTDVVWEGWGTDTITSSFSWRGEPLPFVPYKGMSEEFQKAEPSLRIPHDAGRAANPHRIEPARIKVEMIDAPLFVVGGDQDTVWASGPMARSIAEQRNDAGLETEIYVSATAGHFLSGNGYSSAFEAEAKIKGVAYPAMLDFFERHLKPARSTN